MLGWSNDKQHAQLAAAWLGEASVEEEDTVEACLEGRDGDEASRAGSSRQVAWREWDWLTQAPEGLRETWQMGAPGRLRTQTSGEKHEEQVIFVAPQHSQAVKKGLALAIVAAMLEWSDKEGVGAETGAMAAKP
ncbi:hypothetical protein NDU88_004628 [Pleurodeles waltl]|uniref:Uncharacterized protein n=1 Tax=Pleurodeles waltl TaxID=8319 RepID=A0AAV7MAK8_PLEWA|nr:hypothetical protein NDU88_004628 [Pleurodeles waltl]